MRTGSTNLDATSSDGGPAHAEATGLHWREVAAAGRSDGDVSGEARGEGRAEARHIAVWVGFLESWCTPPKQRAQPQPKLTARCGEKAQKSCASGAAGGEKGASEGESRREEGRAGREWAW